MNLFLDLWRQPEQVRSLGLSDWNLLLREVRALRLEARLRQHLEDAGVHGDCPALVWTEWVAQCHHPTFIQAQSRLEVRKVCKALAGLDTPVLLLKGAGYLLAGLAVARGRLFTDLDVLVPEHRLAAVEAALLAAGWQALKQDAYDQTYYRRWMHELPPLVHPERGMVIDVHHAILPRTHRLAVDPAPLWADSLALARAPLRVLAPADMVLHSAAHLFADGEIAGGLNNLLDLDLLLRDFGAADGFWDHLPDRAARLGLGRPLYYALTTCVPLCGTPVPAAVMARVQGFAPPAPVAWFMRRLIRTVLTPHYPYRRRPAISAWLLYLRSHWLRMPPGLLAGHLWRKLLMRLPSADGHERKSS